MRPAKASCGIEIIAGKILDTLHNALFRVTSPVDQSTQISMSMRPARASCGIEIIAGKILDILHNALFRITSPVDQSTQISVVLKST
jgi:translation initiation factor IF-1